MGWGHNFLENYMQMKNEGIKFRQSWSPFPDELNAEEYKPV